MALGLWLKVVGGSRLVGSALVLPQNGRRQAATSTKAQLVRAKVVEREEVPQHFLAWIQE